MDVITEFPYLVPLSEKHNDFDGFITIAGQDFRIRILCDSNLKETEIYVDWKLQYVWEQNKALIAQRLEQSPDIKSFLSEIQFILGRHFQNSSRPSIENFSSDHYRQILHEIEELGWKKIMYINDDFKEIHLKATDEASREHVLQIEIIQKSVEPPILRANLPINFQLNRNQAHSLKSIYSQFLHQLSLFQKFWNQMDEVDAETWILEPDKPTRSDVTRRIAISYYASVQITVDPLHVEALPECLFLGSDEAINKLKQVFNSNLEKWNGNSSLLANLRALGLEFSSPEEFNKEDLNMDCGICYSYHFNNSIPDKICDDSRCRQPFHCVCLYEWLKALTTSRHSFNMIFGECPYCNKPISCKMPKSK